MRKKTSLLCSSVECLSERAMERSPQTQSVFFISLLPVLRQLPGLVNCITKWIQRRIDRQREKKRAREIVLTREREREREIQRARERKRERERERERAQERERALTLTHCSVGCVAGASLSRDVDYTVLITPACPAY